MRLIDADSIHYTRVLSQQGLNMELAAKVVIDDMPTIDAAPVVHGQWKFHDPDKHGNRRPYCSNCGEYHLTSWSDYVRCKICPNCGAKMDKEEPNE